MNVPGVRPLYLDRPCAGIGSGEAFGVWARFLPPGWASCRINTSRVGAQSWAGSPNGGSKYLRTPLIQAAKVLLMRPHNWARYSFGPCNDKTFDTRLEVSVIYHRLNRARD
jgi:hypothetical protein